MIANDFNLVSNLFYFLYVFIFQVICQLSQWRTYLQAGILTKDANYGNYEIVAVFCEYKIKNRSTISIKNSLARNKKGLFVIIIYIDLSTLFAFQYFWFTSSSVTSIFKVKFTHETISFLVCHYGGRDKYLFYEYKLKTKIIMPNTLPWFTCTLPSCNNDQSTDKDLHVP